MKNVNPYSISKTCPCCDQTYYGPSAVSRWDDETEICPECGSPVVRDVDGAAARLGRTRNEFMSMCLEFALDHLEIEAR